MTLDHERKVLLYENNPHPALRCFISQNLAERVENARHLWQNQGTREIRIAISSRTDQVVQFNSADPKQPEATFTSWAHLLPNGMVTADINLKWNDGNARQLSDSVLVAPGDAQAGTLLNFDGVEYQLFHVVSLLDRAPRDA